MELSLVRVEVVPELQKLGAVVIIIMVTILL